MYLNLSINLLLARSKDPRGDRPQHSTSSYCDTSSFLAHPIPFFMALTPTLSSPPSYANVRLSPEKVLMEDGYPKKRPRN